MIFGVMGVRQCLELSYAIYYVTGMLTGTVKKHTQIYTVYVSLLVMILKLVNKGLRRTRQST